MDSSKKNKTNEFYYITDLLSKNPIIVFSLVPQKNPLKKISYSPKNFEYMEPLRYG